MSSTPCVGACAATMLPVVAVTAAVMMSCARVPRALPTARPEAIGLARAGLERIAPAMQAYVDSGRLAGVIAIVARRGHVGYARSFGWLDVERKRPMRRDAIFRIYSMTKPCYYG